MKNAAGETLGDEVQFAIGTGGGGQTGGTIVAIAFQSTPVYGSYGSTLRTFAAIRSVTSNGVESSDNLIEKLELVDRESGLTVWTETVNKASSGDMKDFSFELDFTTYFTAAGTRKFKLIATDESGNTGSKNVNVTAVDITCTCVQVLNYTLKLCLLRQLKVSAFHSISSETIPLIKGSVPRLTSRLTVNGNPCLPPLSMTTTRTLS